MAVGEATNEPGPARCATTARGRPSCGAERGGGKGKAKNAPPPRPPTIASTGSTCSLVRARRRQLGRALPQRKVVPPRARRAGRAARRRARARAAERDRALAHDGERPSQLHRRARRAALAARIRHALGARGRGRRPLRRRLHLELIRRVRRARPRALDARGRRPRAVASRRPVRRGTAHAARADLHALDETKPPAVGRRGRCAREQGARLRDARGRLPALERSMAGFHLVTGVHRRRNGELRARCSAMMDFALRLSRSEPIRGQAGFESGDSPRPVSVLFFFFSFFFFFFFPSSSSSSSLLVTLPPRCARCFHRSAAAFLPQRWLARRRQSIGFWRRELWRCSAFRAAQ